MRRVLAIPTVAIACLLGDAAHPCSAQEPDRAPVLNSIGRFFGVGYSAGYHARYDNRFGLKHTPPSQNVVPSPYHRPMQVNQVQAMPQHAMPYGAMHPAMGSAMPMIVSPTPAQITVTPEATNARSAPGRSGVAQPELVPAAPAKPAVPPPSWLRPFLKPDGSTGQPSTDTPDAASPSDRRGVQLNSGENENSTGLFVVPDPAEDRPDYSLLQP